MGRIPSLSDESGSDETVVLNGFFRQCEDDEGNSFLAWGPYRVGETLGKGGLGMVVEACRLDDLDRVAVALKIPRRDACDKALAFRFLAREARMISNLCHSHILPVLDWSDEPTCPYLAMPLMPGRSLAHLLANQIEPLPLDRILKWAHQLASALSFAHRKMGIIHRDLKPENILLNDQDDVLLSDFGLHQQTSHDSTGEMVEGAVIGSFPYLPPESYRAERADLRGDIYALGVVMYRLISGELPFQGNSYGDFKHTVLHDSPLPLVARRSDVPTPLSDVVEKAMARAIEDRFPTMEAMLKALDNVSCVTSEGSESKTNNVRAWFSRYVVLGWLGVGVILVLLIGWAMYPPSNDAGKMEAEKSEERSAGALPYEITLANRNQFDLPQDNNNFHSFLVVQWFADPAKEIVCFGTQKASIVSLEGGEILDQIGFTDRELVTIGRSYMAADIDGDGLEEIFLVGRKKEELCLSVFNQHGLEVRRFEATGSYVEDDREGERRAYDSYLVPMWWGDLDGDKRPEVLVALKTGHLLQPRALLCFDGTDEGLEWRYDFANEINTVEVVTQPRTGLREVWVGGAAVGNGATGREGTSDFESYLYRLSRRGKLEERTRLGEVGSHLNCRQMGERAVVVATTSNQPDSKQERRMEFLMLDVESAEIRRVSLDRVPQNVVRLFGYDGQVQSELYVNAPILTDPIYRASEEGASLTIVIENGRLFEVDVWLSKVLASKSIAQVAEAADQVYCRFAGAGNWMGEGLDQLLFIVMDQTKWIQNTTSLVTSPPTQTSNYGQRLVLLGENLDVVASNEILTRAAKVAFTPIVDDLDGDSREEVICLKDRGLVFDVISR